MVLEERVIFELSEDATAFVAFLKKNDCPCRKEVQMITYDDAWLSGTLDQVISWLGAEAARCQENGEDVDSFWFGKAGEYHQNVRDISQKIMEENAAGDLVSTRDELVDDIVNLIAETDGELGDDTTSSNLIDSAAHSLALLTLAQNGVVHEEPDGFRLEQITPAGSLRTSLNLSIFPPIELDGEMGLTRIHDRDFRLIHVVVADPLIHITCDSGEILDFLDGLSVPDDLLDSLEERLASTALLISLIVQEIEQVTSTDVATLAASLNGMVVTDQEDGTAVRIGLDEEIVSSVVSVLRKRDILAGTDQKIRMAGGRKRRR
jgi:hypothetical protein